MIVKVQVSIVGSLPNTQMLIYNKTRTICHQDDLSSDVKELMKERKKAYFFATLKNGIVNLGDEAPEQDW